MSPQSSSLDCCFALFFSTGAVKEIVDLFPSSPEFHSSVVVIDGLPWRKFIGKHPPLAACFVQVQDRINHCSHRISALSSAVIRTSGEGLNEFPLAIG